MRDKTVTKDYYINKLGFQVYGDNDYDDYLMVYKDTKANTTIDIDNGTKFKRT